ncbi:MAG: type III pantothenate kinase [Planctomycetota bacterium]
MNESRQPPVLAVQVGNTRIKLAVFRSEDPDEVVLVPKADTAAAIEAAVRLYESIGAEPDAAVLVASVNKPVSDALVAALRDQLDADIYAVPDDMPAPIGTCLAPDATPGVDRLLNAAAAWHKLRQACVVIDAGTAITVDFVDGEGVFHGGAIAPGLRMQLKALHEHTAALPDLEFSVPEGTAWGADTREAMLRGVYHGARGLAWRLIERYAEEYGGFPMVVATGGDAQALFGDDELVNQIVPDLVLRGMAIAAKSALEPDAGDPLAGGDGGAQGAGFSLLPGQAAPRRASIRDLPIHVADGDGDIKEEHGCGHDDCSCGHDHD